MFQYIDTEEKLNNLIKQLSPAKWLTLDTEFIRERTYYPRLCLIQIASEDTLACIDPLAIEDLSPFFAFLNEENRIKVLHSAWQDLEIIHHLTNGTVPSPIFDTQIAAAVLGMGDQLGYARLVEEGLGIMVDKSQSRTDWAQRPLSQAQLEYAIADVSHLRHIYLKLKAQIESLGRTTWLEKSFQKLANPQSYAVEPRKSWERVKGLQRLKPHQLAILREVAAWREERALQHDLPRRWLLSDEILIDIAQMQPKDATSFQHIRGLSHDYIEKHANEWLNCIERAKALPKEEHPRAPQRRKLDAEMNLIADLLMVLLNQIAHTHGISATMIATRPQIEKMLEEGRTTLSDDWQGNLVNDVFSTWLSGKSSVKFSQESRLTLIND